MAAGDGGGGRGWGECVGVIKRPVLLDIEGELFSSGGVTSRPMLPFNAIFIGALSLGWWVVVVCKITIYIIMPST